MHSDKFMGKGVAFLQLSNTPENNRERKSQHGKIIISGVSGWTMSKAPLYYLGKSRVSLELFQKKTLEQQRQKFLHYRRGESHKPSLSPQARPPPLRSQLISITPAGFTCHWCHRLLSFSLESLFRPWRSAPSTACLPCPRECLLGTSKSLWEWAHVHKRTCNLWHQYHKGEGQSFTGVELLYEIKLVSIQII